MIGSVEANARGIPRKVEVASSALQSAVERAIQQSVNEVRVLDARVSAALDAFRGLLNESDIPTETPTAAQDLRRALGSAHSEAADLFSRQCDSLATVNIVLFGRTGAGKSTLIEALSHGEGKTISTGECDFTVEIRPTNWRGIQFIDTPGINGWGRTEKRDVLETRTRSAVELADIVVLCFDSTSQQASEFEKIASWVKEFGKPVICVLNARNAHWRRSGDVALASQRLRLSQMVREHTSNITTELSAIGIHGAPVVAISAQRAAYARTTDDYAGPLPEQCHKLRQRFGRDGLLLQSNLEIFETVIATALTQHALEIRLGMLNAQVRALLEKLACQLDEAKGAALAAANTIDTAIRGILEIVGYPAAGSLRRAALPKLSSGKDLLAAAEEARGEAYSGSAEGRVARFSKQRCNSKFGKLRSESISAANLEINNSFDRRCDLDAETFASRAYDPPKIEQTGKSVLTGVAEHLRRELKLALSDAALDLEFTAQQSAGVAGSSGSTIRNVGIASRVCSIVAGFLGTAALINLAAPEPIITKGTALVLGIVSGLTGFLGEWLTDKAKKEREMARVNALAEATRSVNATYDAIGSQIEASVEAMLQDSGREALAESLKNATALWRISAKASYALDQLTPIIADLPVRVNAQLLLEEAAMRAANRSGGVPGDETRILLGEDWISDPTGLKAEAGIATPQRTQAYERGIFERLFAGLRGFVVRFTGKVRPGSSSEWLNMAEAKLGTEEAAKTSLVELRTMLSSGRSRYHLLGDYSTGKTSFIKRLLIDAGLPLPPTLEVRADPATDAIHLYEWERALLVDSPGLQSSRVTHTDLALKSVADASLVICLFQPNLIVGSTGPLEQILKGDRSRGYATKLDRTIFVIHRADELGPDPELVPKQYAQLCQRKQLELQQALASLDIRVGIERIVCMAADPHQRVGNRRDVNSTEFDRFRDWDGFRDFHAAVQTIQDDSAATGLDYSVLEGGLARLGAISVEMDQDALDLKLRRDVFGRQSAIFSEITTAGDLLEGDLNAQARRMVDDYLQRLLVMETNSDEELKNKVVALAKWWEQPDFIAAVEHWQKQSQGAVEDWWSNCAERLRRTMNSPRFKAAVASATQELDESFHSSSKPGAIRRVLNLATAPLKGATREAIYAAGKTLGKKFRPWEAVKTAKNLRGLGAALSGALAVVDTVALFNFFKNENKDQERQKKLDDFIAKSREEAFKSITQTEDEALGPLEAMHFLKTELGAVERELKTEREAINELYERLHARRLCYKGVIDAAWLALGEPLSQTPKS